MFRRKRISYVNYIKKPLAVKSIIAMVLTVVAAALMFGCFHLTVGNAGKAELNAAALGFCSLLLGIVGTVYGFLGFGEKEKNYILSRISVVLGGILSVFWIVMIIIGFGG